MAASSDAPRPPAGALTARAPSAHGHCVDLIKYLYRRIILKAMPCQGIEAGPSARYKERAPQWPLHHWGARLKSLMPRPPTAKLSAGAIHEKPVSHGEGVLVRAGYCSQSADRCKSQSQSITEISPGTPPPRRGVPLTPADRARRLAKLRAMLRDAAPTFQARIAAEEQGAQP